MKKTFLILSLLSFQLAFTQQTTIPKIDDKATAERIFSNSSLFKNKSDNYELENDSSNFLVESIQKQGDRLIINDSISLTKGGELQIWLPAGKDFVFVQRKKSGLGMKALGAAANVVGTGANVIGMTSGNTQTILDAYRVANTARGVKYSLESIEEIQNLDLSKSAKKIAGKKFEIIDFEFEEAGWKIIASFENKKYEIPLQEAVMVQEILIH